MARFPIFADRPPRTLDEVEQQVHDARLVGLSLLLVGAALAGAGSPDGLGSGNKFLWAGLVLGLVGVLLLAVLPAWLRWRWHRRLRLR